MEGLRGPWGREAQEGGPWGGDWVLKPLSFPRQMRLPHDYAITQPGDLTCQAIRAAES